MIWPQNLHRINRNGPHKCWYRKIHLYSFVRLFRTYICVFKASMLDQSQNKVDSKQFVFNHRVWRHKPPICANTAICLPPTWLKSDAAIGRTRTIFKKGYKSCCFAFILFLFSVYSSFPLDSGHNWIIFSNKLWPMLLPLKIMFHFHVHIDHKDQLRCK